MNFLTERQETRAGATGSKMLAAPFELGVKVRSGAGPITFFPGRPQVSGCQLVGLRSAGEEEGRKRTGKGRKNRKGKRKRGRGKERSRDIEREKNGSACRRITTFLKSKCLIEAALCLFCQRISFKHVNLCKSQNNRLYPSENLK